MEVLTHPLRRPIDWSNPPSATRRVSSDLICGDGVRFTGSFRTVCHMAWLIDELAREHPDCSLHVIQPPFNTSNESSKGTHDKDSVSDVVIFGMGWREAEAWLNSKGFWCWWRHTGTWADPSDWHIHGMTAPANRRTFATAVGVYVDGGLSTVGRIITSSQIWDWLHDALGLSGQHTPGSNPADQPPKPYPVFNLAAFVKQKEQDLMEYKDWSDASKRQFAADVAKVVAAGNKDLLATQVVVRTADNTSTTKVSLKAAIARAANAVPLIRAKTGNVIDMLKASDSSNA